MFYAIKIVSSFHNVEDVTVDDRYVSDHRGYRGISPVPTLYGSRATAVAILNDYRQISKFSNKQPTPMAIVTIAQTGVVGLVA